VAHDAPQGIGVVEGHTVALDASGTLANVYGSLDTYIQTNLDGTGGFAIQYHGQRRFVRPSDDPWIEVHYDFLGLQAQYKRHVGGDRFGTERRGYLQLNCYQRIRVFTQRYVTASMRDTVVAVFPEGGLIPVYDITGAPSTGDPDHVGTVIIDGLQEHVVDTGYRSGVMQHLVQVSTRYLEIFTRV
jgi:hypothetical protein